MKMSLARTARQLHLENVVQTADSVEALDSSVFACATYQLQKSTPTPTEDKTVIPDKRVGSIGLYRIIHQYQNSQFKVTQTQVISCNGVLDMKWSSSAKGDILAVADSSGNCILYDYKKDNVQVSKTVCIDQSVLALSLDWVKTPMPEKIIVSLSNGELALIQVHDERMEPLNIWKAHCFEAWITAADFTDENIIYSGGDDCLLKLWDVRQGFCKPTSVSKHFSMGVCSIQSMWCNSNLFSAGSYDENVVIWDKRNMRRCISETKTGGGVWRIKWHPLIKDVLLTACMHNGFHIYKYDDSFTSANEVCVFDQQAQLAYGADWCLQRGNPSKDLTTQNILDQSYIATCSFYDHSMKVWDLPSDLEES